MITVLRYLYTAYVAIVFVVFLIITAPFFFLFSFLGGDKALLPILNICKFIAYGFGAFSGIFYKFHGMEKIDKSKAYMLIANHRSNLDAPVSAAACWGRVRYLGKKELLKIPLLGQLLKVTIIIVDRGNSESRKKSIIQLAEYMKHGDSVFIFPEGTRNKTLEQPLIEFKDGAFRIAIELQAPILPMLFINTDSIMPYKPLLMKPGIVHIHYLEPISTAGLNGDDVPMLRDKLRKIMTEKYLQLTQ
ncbi:MAG: lysophospholipid acyltransferase family protein [Chitinophagales bacterium]